MLSYFEFVKSSLWHQQAIWQYSEENILTNEFVGFFQPGQQLFTVAVIDGNAQEVVLTDEVWLWTGVAGI